MGIRIIPFCLNDDIPDSEITCPICGSHKVVPIYYMGPAGLPGAEMKKVNEGHALLDSVSCIPELNKNMIGGNRFCVECGH